MSRSPFDGRINALLAHLRSRGRGMQPHWPSCLAYTAACVTAALVVVLSSALADGVGHTSEVAFGLVGGLVVALLVLAIRPHGIPLISRKLDPLLSMLSTHWRGLLIVYGLTLLAWGALTKLTGVGWWPFLFPSLLSNPADYPKPLVANLVTIALFLLLQFVFVGGVGRVRIVRGPERPWKLTLTLAIFATALVIEILGSAFVFLLAVNTATTEEPLASAAFLGTPVEVWVLIVIGAIWMFWFSVGWILARNVDRDTVLGRLLSLLIAGSWLEFAVALPVELVTKDRSKDCPCASPSWLALLTAGPLLLWAIGPGIYLLYRREYRLTMNRPGHARRVLQRKTTRQRVAAP